MAVAHLHGGDRGDARALQIPSVTSNVRFSQFDFHDVNIAKPLEYEIGDGPEMLLTAALISWLGLPLHVPRFSPDASRNSRAAGIQRGLTNDPAGIQYRPQGWQSKAAFRTRSVNLER